ncbi:hypothetical protein KIN20_023667 [Parelaphostrongylus tenuis]|nr:hypothetical protein KIN20_023667 [Parelaphostrongylus tenuis]
MSVDFHGRPSSLNRFMEGKGRSKNGFSFELCAGQRHEVLVEVRALYQMLENDEPGTSCRNVEDGEDNEFDCKSRCRMNMIREMCKCTPLSLSYLADDDDLDKYPLCDYTKCDIDVQKGNYSDSECADGCLRNCRQVRYEIDHEVQGKMVRPDLTLINLNWGSFEYLTMEQQWKYSVTAFIAALGGSIGMWLGLSILSLIQGGTYLYTYFTKRVVKEKILKKISEQHNRRKESKLSGYSDVRDVPPTPPAPPPPAVSKKISIGANPFGNPFSSLAHIASYDVNAGKQEPLPPGYSRNPNPSKMQIE